MIHETGRDMPERAMTFECEGEQLMGVLHFPDGIHARVGVVVVVGGPQYRVGSHRQFVLMARAMAGAGFTVLRFDYRGMGDSTGTPRNFESIDADIAASVSSLLQEDPSLRRVYLLGLCDAASAVLIYCNSDPRVNGLILLNPWVRSEAGVAEAVVRHYYGRRLLQRAFWAKVCSGEFRPVNALFGLASTLIALISKASPAGNFVDRMAESITDGSRPVLLLLSERDLTAKEFESYCNKLSLWREWLAAAAVRVVRLTNADHTFSSRESLTLAMSNILTWLVEQGHSPDNSKQLS
jgi:uncharacterized protein